MSIIKELEEFYNPEKELQNRYYDYLPQNDDILKGMEIFLQ